MDKDAAVDARLLGEHVVPKAAPDLRQRLAAVEALGPDGHGLHTPVVRRLVRVQYVDRLRLLGDLQLLLEIGEVLLPRQELVEDDDLPAGRDVGLSGLLDRGRDEVAGRKPGVGIVIKARDELLSDERRSLQEPGLIAFIEPNCVGVICECDSHRPCSSQTAHSRLD